MQRKSLSQLFQTVDPNLRVVRAGLRNKKTDWEMAEGDECPRCHKKSLKFRIEDGVCANCARWLNEKEIRDAKKNAKLLKFVKSHNARIDRHKKGR